MKDFSSYETSGASAASLALLEQVFHELRCFIGDPVATAEQALAATPELVMAHVLKAYLHLLMSAHSLAALSNRAPRLITCS